VKLQGNISILKNARWSLLARVLNVVLKAIAVIYLARLLGPNEFGIFTLILTAAALITVFIDLGISPATARFLAEEKWNNRKILLSSFTILLGVYFTIAGLLLLFGGHLFNLINAAVLDDFSVYLILLIFFQVKHQFFKKCYEGLKRVDLSSKVSLVFDWTPWGLALIFVLIFNATANYAVLGKLAGSILILIGLGIPLWKIINDRQFNITRSFPGYFKIFSYALPMLVTAISFYIYTHSDILIIQGFLGETEVGIYGVAVRLLETLHVPAAAIGSAVAAYFVTVRNNEPENLDKLYYDTTNWTLFIFFPLSVGLAVTAKDLIPFLFGHEYSAAGIIAIIYTPMLLAKSLSATYSLALDYMGYAKQRAIAISISAALNIGLNFIMIPRYGIIGAAVTTQITYLPLVLWYSVMIQRLTNSNNAVLLKKVLPILISGITMGLVVFTVNHFTEQHILTLIFIGIIVYLVSAYSSGAFKISEVKKLLNKQ